MTKLELERKIEEIREILSREISEFANDTPERQRARIQKSRVDFEYFCRQYLPNYFTSPSGEHHKEIDRYLEEKQSDIIAYVGPREDAKTVRWSIAYELWSIINRKRHYIINVSETEDLAIEMNLNVREQFSSNVRVMKDFGNTCKAGTNWSEEDFICNGVKTLALGYGQKIRGRIYGPYRPDLIRVDDISSLRSSRNELLEKEKLEWVLGEAYGGLSSDGTLFWTGNILRKTSAIAQLEKESEKPEREIRYIKKAAYRVKPDGEWEILWKERYDRAYYELKRKKVGKIIFEREWLQNPVEEGVYFQEGWFNRFSQQEAMALWEGMERRIIYIDPSYGKKKKTAKSPGSNKKVAVVLGKSKYGYFLFDAISRQMSLEGFFDGLIELYKRWPVGCVYYEGNYGQADIIGKYLKEAMVRKQYNIPIKAWYNKMNKEDRIESASPLAETGRVYAVKGNTDVQDIVDNLIMYPDIEFDDPADAFGSGIIVLDARKHTVNARIIGRR